jgi:hypothetical protein
LSTRRQIHYQDRTKPVLIAPVLYEKQLSIGKSVKPNEPAGRGDEN